LTALDEGNVFDVSPTEAEAVIADVGGVSLDEKSIKATPSTTGTVFKDVNFFRHLWNDISTP
jgi:hypothetical protein